MTCLSAAVNDILSMRGCTASMRLPRFAEEVQLYLYTLLACRLFAAKSRPGQALAFGLVLISLMMHMRSAALLAN